MTHRRHIDAATCRLAETRAAEIRHAERGGEGVPRAGGIDFDDTWRRGHLSKDAATPRAELDDRNLRETFQRRAQDIGLVLGRKQELRAELLEQMHHARRSVFLQAGG